MIYIMFNALSIISDSVRSVQRELTEMYEMEVERGDESRNRHAGEEKGCIKTRWGDDKV